MERHIVPSNGPTGGVLIGSRPRFLLVSKVANYRKSNERNRPFPSFLVPLFQNEFSYKTFLVKMSLICMKVTLNAELIFIWMVSHVGSFWHRDKRQLGNGQLTKCNVSGFWKRMIGTNTGMSLFTNLKFLVTKIKVFFCVRKHLWISATVNYAYHRPPPAPSSSL